MVNTRTHNTSPSFCCGRALKVLLCGCALVATIVMSNATPIFSVGNPAVFFTNVASCLLSSELNLNLTQLPIYPTNQYTPAVHRLLQVTANVYDAMTTNFYPSVFRPVFYNDGTNVYITGYETVVLNPGLGLDDPHLALPMDVTALPSGTSTNNVYGIPWIIGARWDFRISTNFRWKASYGLNANWRSPDRAWTRHSVNIKRTRCISWPSAMCSASNAGIRIVPTTRHRHRSKLWRRTAFR